MFALSRRQFLASSAAVGAAAGLSLSSRPALAAAEDVSIALGLVTYMWGADWDLPTLLANCKKANLLGVELRTTHAHKVEPDLNDKQRGEGAAKFSDAGITCVRLGSDERPCKPAAELQQEATDAR